MHDEQSSHQSLNRVAFSATVYCLTGFAIGEVFGMVTRIARATSAGSAAVQRLG